VDLLSRGIDAARALAPDTAVPRLAALEADLSSRFGRLSRDDMRAQPETARAALRSIGSTDSGVLLHAALQVGDRTNATTEVFRDDPLALERLLSHASDGAQPSLDALAREVGLAEPGWTHQQLASNAVQYGRVGQTIAVVLEHTDDEAGARQVVADDLIVRQAFTTTA